MKANNGEQGIALERYYQFMLWLVPTVEKFPRSQKFLLGDRIQDLALTVLEQLIEATYHPRAASDPRAGQSGVGETAHNRNNNIGFRVARTAPTPEPVAPRGGGVCTGSV